jgi:glucose-1-phosphate adenylyltransferase
MVQRPSTTPVFILAGGAGERLRPLTQAKPKPAVSFGGTHQILDFTLSNCINSGLRKIFVLTQHHREPLHDYVRENRLKMVQAFRWHEGDELRALPPVSGKHYRGTADAVFQNLPLLRFETAEHVLIASGDHVYSMDYRPLIARHAVSGADLTIAAVRRPAREASAFGVVEVENGVATRFTEKPPLETLPQRGDVLVNMGIYVFRRQALLDIADRAHPMETDFGRDIVPKLIYRENVAVYDFGETRKHYWRDVGSLDNYFQANMDLLADYPEVSLEAQADWPVLSLGDSSIMRSSDSRISRRAVTAGSTIRNSIVSCGACIEPGTLIEDSVILPGAQVGRNTRVRNAIVAEGASVPSGLRIGLNPQADQSRFVVTEGGVVVVGGSLRRVTERAAYARSTQPAPTAG